MYQVTDLYWEGKIIQEKVQGFAYQVGLYLSLKSCSARGTGRSGEGNLLTLLPCRRSGAPYQFFHAESGNGYLRTPPVPDRLGAMLHPRCEVSCVYKISAPILP